MASARGLRSWRGGVRGGWVGLASKMGGVSGCGTFGERLGVAGAALEVGSGGVGGREAGFGSRMVRGSGRDEVPICRAAITVELPEL